MEYLKRRIKNKIYQFLIIVGILFIFFGLATIIKYDYLNKERENLNNKMIEDFFYMSNDTNEAVIVDMKEEQFTKKREESYIAILEIPKINLKQGIVGKNNYKNHVDKNIYMIKETTLPNEQANSHIILASHSGNSPISYFKNIYKLEMNDKIYFYYKGLKYIYKITKKYEIEKTGKMEFQEAEESNITLITCIGGTNKQIVFMAKLVDKSAY